LWDALWSRSRDSAAVSARIVSDVSNGWFGNVPFDAVEIDWTRCIIAQSPARNRHREIASGPIGVAFTI
jgi:hypothetical protein